jgi:hypothetical protein
MDEGRLRADASTNTNPFPDPEVGRVNVLELAEEPDDAYSGH